VSAQVHLSIVSHGQAGLVSGLLADIAQYCAPGDLTISVLANVPEEDPVIPTALSGRVACATNETPAGFGANHNKVFASCAAPFFCVLNPDLRLTSDPFPALLAVFADPRIALAAPAALDPQGVIQDNARELPTPWRVASKLWSAPRGPDYKGNSGVVHSDWVSGFFMLCRSSAFRELGGFDERYFLYYEDIDLCTRARLAGWKNAWLPGVTVVHDARRRSHRDAKYLLSHLRSIARFFASPVYRAARKLGPAPVAQSRL
jgi:N-acetylglucosaminyl-diphospho-decaprenol L-rhamnosyltransferase